MIKKISIVCISLCILTYFFSFLKFNLNGDYVYINGFKILFALDIKVYTAYQSNIYFNLIYLLSFIALITALILNILDVKYNKILSIVFVIFTLVITCQMKNTLQINNILGGTSYVKDVVDLSYAFCGILNIILCIMYILICLVMIFKVKKNFK